MESCILKVATYTYMYTFFGGAYKQVEKFTKNLTHTRCRLCVPIEGSEEELLSTELLPTIDQCLSKSKNVKSNIHLHTHVHAHVAVVWLKTVQETTSTLQSGTKLCWRWRRFYLPTQVQVCLVLVNVYFPYLLELLAHIQLLVM